MPGLADSEISHCRPVAGREVAQVFLSVRGLRNLSTFPSAGLQHGALESWTAPLYPRCNLFPTGRNCFVREDSSLLSHLPDFNLVHAAWLSNPEMSVPFQDLVLEIAILNLGPSCLNDWLILSLYHWTMTYFHRCQVWHCGSPFQTDYNLATPLLYTGTITTKEHLKWIYLSSQSAL